LTKLIILGPQGCGKGTQAKKLAKEFNLKHISTGDIFREIQEKDTEIGKKVKDLINNGINIPDDITISIIKDKLKEYENYILDGFPRNLEQAKALGGIDKVIFLKISNEEVLHRLEGRRNCKKCGSIFNVNTFPKPKVDGICDNCGSELFQRGDDRPEQIKKRLEQYYSLTLPLIDFFKDILVEIDGSKNIEEVYSEIVCLLDF
jgi:adenylate kinase